MNFKYANTYTIQCIWQGISLKSERNNQWFKPWFIILLHKQSIVCATVDSHCLEYLGYITLEYYIKPLFQYLLVFRISSQLACWTICINWNKREPFDFRPHFSNSGHFAFFGQFMSLRIWANRGLSEYVGANSKWNSIVNRLGIQKR